MKIILGIPVGYFFVALFIAPVSAEENRNQYSSSIMFKAPTVYEDANHKSKTDLQNQHCLDLQKNIEDLGFRPVRRNAAQERYKAECFNK